ncbi:hypothetical protein JCM3774_002783 [Rhodotorula dairenensis]
MATPEQQLAALQATLAQVHRTRAALPALVAAVLTPTAAANLSPAAQYRTAAQECHAAIRALADQLEAVQPVLDDAELSAARDPADIVAKSPQQQRRRPQGATAPKPEQDRATWAQVGDILSTPGLHRTGAAARTTTTTNRPFEAKHPVPTSPDDLDALLKNISDRYPRVQVVPHCRTAGPVRRLDLTLRGVLRAEISLRWERDAENEPSRCEAEFVACYSLKEEKPAYVESQFALFRSLSNQAMAIIDRCRVRSAAAAAVAESTGDAPHSATTTTTAAAHSLEEVLVFLSDPPLPF